MFEISPAYLDEVATGWENSALDARIYLSDHDYSPTPAAQLTPLIEATFHAASAGDFDAAAAILYNRLYLGPRAQLTNTLGHNEVALDLLRHFFPRQDLTLDPRTSDARSRRWLMHETAACLHAVGRLDESTSLAGRAAMAAMAMGDPHNAAVTYHNLAETLLARGALGSCRSTAEAALTLAAQSGNQEDALVAYTILGYLGDLTDQPEPAGDAYDAALRIAVEDTSVPMLYSLSGVRYARHLLAADRPAESLHASQANLTFCREQGWTSDVALVLALLTVTPSDLPEAELERFSQETADLARSSGNKQVLAEVLLAQANYRAASGQYPAAVVAADEAMMIAQSYGLRLAEVDARLLLSAVHSGQGNATNGTAEAYLARDLARELGYVRAHRRADELLS
jgi:hypothetical protein